MDQDKPKKRIIGLREGSLKYMADDFDEPLDDFEEYMPDGKFPMYQVGLVW